MQQFNKALSALAEHLEEARRAFGLLATELEILDSAFKQTRREVQEGLVRERDLLDLLKTRGLASDAPPTTTEGEGEAPTPTSGGTT